jgi:hypothetical protein
MVHDKTHEVVARIRYDDDDWETPTDPLTHRPTDRLTHRMRRGSDRWQTYLIGELHAASDDTKLKPYSMFTAHIHGKRCAERRVSHPV